MQRNISELNDEKTKADKCGVEQLINDTSFDFVLNIKRMVRISAHHEEQLRNFANHTFDSFTKALLRIEIMLWSWNAF